ncbi:hypothetical protein [Gottfriedia solisilvae]|uniref:Lipoprotein n=2 Tax=Gottfriedia solisilvae TaxID=1516104 RepID=A0A8J3F098_9BACI|nr:hypothetical protein [Gottfriedia solisilvae]GGI11719.1 hypothetical protein GCM10007380_09250 [Gottfriedia solisilvae]
MKNIKKIIQIIILSTSTLILSGCFSKEHMYKPVKDYLKANYGLTENIKIVSATNYWLAGVDHSVFIKISKPYHAYIDLQADFDSLEVIPEEGDDVYLEIFKGAYIEQHSEVIKFSNHLIEKYKLVSPQQHVNDEVNDEAKARAADLYYLHINIGGKTQKSRLIEQFKKSQKIDTTSILATIVKRVPEVETYHMGIVNFTYEYKVTNKKRNVPNSKVLAEEFKRSKLLQKGLYCIEIQVEDKEGYSDDEHSSYSLFRVDDNGNYTLIPVRSNNR